MPNGGTHLPTPSTTPVEWRTVDAAGNLWPTSPRASPEAFHPRLYPEVQKDASLWADPRVGPKADPMVF